MRRLGIIIFHEHKFLGVEKNLIFLKEIFLPTLFGNQRTFA